jgi:nitrite reductase (NADH) large subunit
VQRVAGRFIQYYREKARYKERTYTFVPRIGLEKLQKILLEDSEGIAAALDRAMEESTEAAYDVWKERDVPKTQNQFRTSLPVVQWE